MSFVKVTEDFVCEHCSHHVAGSGYTNHCHNCLYSKHVDDQFPGDRASICGGLMKPVGLETKGDQYTIIHQCLACGKIIKNKTAENDNQEKLIKLSSRGES